MIQLNIKCDDVDRYHYYNCMEEITIDTSIVLDGNKVSQGYRGRWVNEYNSFRDNGSTTWTSTNTGGVSGVLGNTTGTSNKSMSSYNDIIFT